MRATQPVAATLAAAMLLSAGAARADDWSAPATGTKATSTNAPSKCGPKPTAPGAWVCKQVRQKSATRNAGASELVWTWVKGGVTATDDWTMPQ